MNDRYSKYKDLVFDSPAEHVLRIRINRPDRLNAMTQDTHSELTEVWRDVGADESVRSVIIGGTGKAFSVGGEFEFVEAIINDFAMRERAWREARDLVYNIINCPKPIVSAMQGAVAGGGLSIGLLADISIATKSAKLVDAHTRLGVCAGDHAVMLWPLLCGLARAKHLLLLCEPISGEKAADIGLVSMCVDDDELDSTALRIATQLAKGAPLAIQTTKYALNNWLRMAGPAFDASTALQFFSFGGPEPKEGLTAHQQKRPPSF
ncbi:MAG: enoyl-CoA hydratase [Betaproteobacteria bacterium]|jgi:enoyl-CoA hydratase|nr:enoyl-CoA hydratase [Betaproteobacteria bacterium]